MEMAAKRHGVRPIFEHSPVKSFESNGLVEREMAEFEKQLLILKKKKKRR